MALTPQTYQFVNQIGALRLVDASGDPSGPNSTVSYWLVPSGGWSNGQRFPHDVSEDLDAQNYDKTTVEGIEYYLVPEESSNTPGRLSHYAQLTGVAELQNPSSGGVNRVRETFAGPNSDAQATVAPEAVSKYVEDNDSWEEARKKKSEHDERVNRAVSKSPAREPAEGKLVIADASDDSGKTRGSKANTETSVKPAGDTKTS